ncbi:hypothetical protein MJO29_003810 [Puccinia striiformis f. sp. tritici]|uniref:C2H2-type domain-containing protein n=1 Tax=Puccinia striiformis f. sp. tritici PST-78 TaxID=1165861 RepID=A0A0L0V8J8_9BASI|nr:hypothetical protein Pst134EA_006932 [Puccinia striiformis f. sp. tritici]KAI9616695.1 hypothetical protein KEM48_005112 [Puccinia striiformis f. sp. tritici PST-130]KNE95608.1 hypothetical protein PSTG_11097 [Puccinia striiformis f. sp. tritici PST-78]KAH9459837.1 hypothetical protein Pst134EB_008059 [Puccinia striiformis f. sp. tritici]KAH9469644.1 hypothetical protein Pst134EA_006932 [Puccinia striiformis f. sp. tritici]KAI7963383.1 hypothetical protein MJO29_003810 [Puccinia striiformis
MIKTMMSTDRRHIDPNPDRLQLVLSPPKSHSKSQSLLLLSTSAEAAVAESKKFENNSRHSSVLSISSPPPQPPTSHHHQRIHFRHKESVQHKNHSNSSKTNQLFKCEKCLKVYRHPQCLVKHRWEHTEYWADASKLMLSKHQQVQMLEAAAILAAPSGSLPESRSLWPAAVSSSEAGLLGSDQVNLEVIYSRQEQARNHHHHRSASTSCVPNTILNRLNDDDQDDQDDEDEDEIMFEMSLDGDEQSSPYSTHQKNNSRTGPPPPPPRMMMKTTKSKNITMKGEGVVTGSRSSSYSISSSASSSSTTRSIGGGGRPAIGYFERRNLEPGSSGGVTVSHINPRSSTPTSPPTILGHHEARLTASSLPAMVAYQPGSHPNPHHHGSSLMNHPNRFVYHNSETTIFKPLTPYKDSQLRFEHRPSSSPPSSSSDHHHHHQVSSGSGISSHLLNHVDEQATTDEDEDEDDDDDEDGGWSPSTERADRGGEGDEVVGMEL